jgi:hypothetical protein
MADFLSFWRYMFFYKSEKKPYTLQFSVRKSNKMHEKKLNFLSSGGRRYMVYVLQTKTYTFVDKCIFIHL